MTVGSRCETWVLVGLLWCGLHAFTHAQTLEPTIIGSLPDRIPEASGIEVGEAGHFWLINDSGNPSEIIEVDASGNFVRSVYIANANNVDFEDLCRDQDGALYIGDFGNNLNNRRDLVILKIPNPDTLSTDSVNAEKIFFAFPDQQAFPPPNDQLNFDCEAFFHHENRLYLFSKNRTSDFTRMYSLRAEPGTQEVMLLDSFNMGVQVTAADIDPIGCTVALLAQHQLWLFHDFPRNHFFSGEHSVVSFNNTQREALVFESQDQLILADERENDASKGFLYALNPETARELQPQEKGISIKVVPNPIQSFAQFFPSELAPANCVLSLFGMDGKVLQSAPLPACGHWDFLREDLAAGTYVYRLHVDEEVLDEGTFVLVP